MGVIIHLELDILECEVKWALGSTTMNKASGGVGILVKLYKILKLMLLKCCIQYVSKFGKLSSGHRTERVNQSSSSSKEGQSQRMFKLPLAVSELRASRYIKWVSNRQRNQRSNYQHQLGHRESKGIPEKHLLLLH